MRRLEASRNDMAAAAEQAKVAGDLERWRKLTRISIDLQTSINDLRGQYPLLDLPGGAFVKLEGRLATMFRGAILGR
jgi:hypothetical protein